MSPNKKIVMLFSSFSISHILPLMISVLFLGSFIVLFIPNIYLNAIKLTGLASSFFVFFLSLFLWVFFDKEYARFQFVYDFTWIPSSNLSLGVDGISIFLVILTTLLIPLCLLASWDSAKTAHKEYVIAFLMMEASLICCLSLRDLEFTSYILFLIGLMLTSSVIYCWSTPQQ